MSTRPQLLGPWRLTFQGGIAGLLAVIPFLGIHGIALLRLDIPALTLELAGHRFRIEELYLAWLFVLGLIFLFILTTLVLGRVWCGWACPQTVLSDLADWLDRDKIRRRGRHLVYLGVSLWAGATFVWYFINPAVYLSRLVSGQLGAWPIGTTLTVAALVYGDFALIRRLFCRDFCPYGRFQTVLVDKGTLTLQAPPQEMARCIDCRSCVRVCPTGIDIRQGYQIECINCARCLDACRQVMAKRGEEGIIRYTFGQDDAGWRAILTAKTALLTLIVLGLGATALYLGGHRATASFKIGRAASLATRLSEHGRQRTFFRASIANRREVPQQFTLTVASSTVRDLAIKGPSQFDLSANEKRDLTVAVDSPIVDGTTPLPITFTLVTTGDGSQTSVNAYLAPAERGTTSTRNEP